MPGPEQGGRHRGHDPGWTAQNTHTANSVMRASRVATAAPVNAQRRQAALPKISR